jgi:ABC-type glycerol-3-phosphate transport system substrate-binding protein
VGREAGVVRRQLERFGQANPSIKVALRATPDAADQRHQLYVQWLNARTRDPDVLQLDVIWTSEFAAAGWIAGLDRFHPRVEQFFPAAVTANRWNGALYALPWFIDVGMLSRAPISSRGLLATWQGAAESLGQSRSKHGGPSFETLRGQVAPPRCGHGLLDLNWPAVAMSAQKKLFVNISHFAVVRENPASLLRSQRRHAARAVAKPSKRAPHDGSVD